MIVSSRILSLAPVILALAIAVSTTQATQVHAQAHSLVITRLDGLAHAAFPAVEGAPQVVVAAPAATSDTIDVVLHLHGYDGCAEVLVVAGPTRCRPRAATQQGWDLAGALADSRSGAWLVVPQLAFDTRDGSPGRLTRAGEARRFLDETITRVASARGIPAPRLRSVTLTAHSAGFEAAIAVLRHGGLDDVLRHVVLFDAMYSGVGVFGDWAAADPQRSLVAFHTASGTPSRRALELATHHRRSLGDRLLTGDRVTENDVAPGRVVLARAHTGHRAVPRRYFAPTIARLLGAH